MLQYVTRYDSELSINFCVNECYFSVQIVFQFYFPHILPLIKMFDELLITVNKLCLKSSNYIINTHSINFSINKRQRFSDNLFYAMKILFCFRTCLSQISLCIFDRSKLNPVNKT